MADLCVLCKSHAWHFSTVAISNSNTLLKYVHVYTYLLLLCTYIANIN